MPSSTSSSDAAQRAAEAAGATALMQPGKPGDDPGVAPGPLSRPLPQRSLQAAAWLGGLLLLLGMGAWEWHWRDFGAAPGFRNSDGQWAEQRRRIDADAGGATVLLGASRVLFDIDLDTWQRVSGDRPIQLAVEGTTPLPMLEDLANDSNFSGKVLVGVSPDVFFSGFAYRGGIVPYYHRQTPAQRASERLSMTALEPWLAFYGDSDFAFFTVLERQAWPKRTGVPAFIDVRKLSMTARDRNTHMWHKVENDPAYRALSRQVWAQFFDVPIPGFDTPAKRQVVADKEIARAVAALNKLRARGVKVVFLRAPSADAYYAFEQRDFPRASTWDMLIAKTGAPGIHFEDHLELQGLNLPEWSHLSAADAKRFTEALVMVLEREGSWAAAAPPATDAGRDAPGRSLR